MTLPDRLRLPLTFDAELLRRDLEALAEVDWTAHFVTQNYDGDWSVIPLRCAAGARHPVMMIYSDPMATVFEATPYLAPCPYFRSVIEAFRCDVQSVRLMRLTPGSVIKEHNDHDLDADLGMVRIHIPITTNPDVVFELNRRRIPMAPGEAWYVRLADPHRVANRGASDRVHLVLDAVVNDWLRGMLDDAAAQTSLTVQD